ncbi:arabinosyltransferase domain-containing protein [Candidatus Mycolicibacterium alkanivorans]|uniref:Arabinosyltransferase domain-containing protein n=1 Tax=Candidatus Mycolicibacterium alkanivorans TaxID=2954114 RepID=A0ABS9YSU5_9MYCO|nr:arabinosyltransferase domain-containing protein [Candidatus Mycolicibacterium alkanivorans]MCI4674270.1 arabinosyltransferase domain-containing protein [Candidatus Mycolicibacterium alkanivorans]
MPSDSAATPRIARIVAVVAGILGVLLCGLTPLLPVTQTTAAIQWPQAPGPDGNVSDITAPLVSGAPQSLDVSIPCPAIASLPADGGLVFSTIPPAGIDASRNGLFVRANADTVVVAFRDSVAAVAPRAAIRTPACSTLHMWAAPGGVGADFVGVPGATGTLSPEKKPQVAGIFTDLKVPAQPGLSARIVVDTRFITGPTPVKLGVMALGIACVVASIVALGALDNRSGRKPARAWRRRWRVGWSTWLADIGVVGILLLWHLIGAISSDDGYNLTIARVSGEAGYTANYFRFFGATEAPFDWYQSVLAQLASVSTAGVWMRLPATAAGIGTWLILSRCVLPRLGRRLALNRIAVWTAGAVFLAAWLPFNNGLRPEPLIAFGALAAWILVENAIATRRLVPAALAVVVAVFSVTLAPQGLIATAPILVGARGVARVIQSRRPIDALLAPLAALAAALSVIFVVVFRDQTLANVAESARIKYVVGPTIAWYQDFLRYYFLTVEDNVESSLTRRFAVLVMLLCLFGLLTVLLRRGSVPGVANGPTWRLVGSTAIGLLLLTFTPTKWAVQFGAFAGLAGALGGVTAFAFARVGLHSRRNLTLWVTALLFVLAWATSGINGWFYVGNYGVPWFDRQPVVAHQPVTSMFLGLAVVTGLLAGWLHFRMDYAAGHTEVKNTRRNRALASTPLLVVALIMVLLEVGSMTKAFVQRYPVYTTAKANIFALSSGLSETSCAMADDVLVEPDTNAGMLQPVPGQKWGQYGPLGGENPIGFTPNGISDTLEPAEPFVANPGIVNSDGSPNKPNAGIAFAAGTGGGYGPEGVNGSRVFLPFGLDPKTTPVMGSYKENTVAAKATSAWYRLPPRTPDRPLVTVAAAGAIWFYDEERQFNYGQSLKLQWGVHRPDGSFQALGSVQPIDVIAQKAWRNLRFPLAWAPPDANVARIVADDPNLSDDQWFGFTPPRVPVLQTASEFLGSQTPILMDIATAANFPCQRPFAEHLGVAELPQYRILPNLKQVVVSSNMWQSARAGGPFLFIQALLTTATIPTYLRNDWYRDWGALERYIRLVPADQAPNAVIDQGAVKVFGWNRNGPIRALP